MEISHLHGLEDGLLARACSLANQIHNSPAPTFLLDKTDSSQAIFAFPGSWSDHDWFTRKPFGVSETDPTLFPSLRSVGNAETALINESFLQQFKTVLTATNLQEEVQKALFEGKQIVFTGHSSGGPTAILATIWLLERCKRTKLGQSTISCVTFGSPLVGDKVFGHAIRRESWAHHFTHIITRYDIVPRISLTPLSVIEQILPAILCFFNPNSAYFKQDTIARSSQAAMFFSTVMRNAASVTTHAASLLKGSTSLLLTSVTSFVELSPYRPFGTYIFNPGNGKMVIVKNPDAVLQLFFYCLQLSPEEDIADIANRSLQEHLTYEPALQNLQQQHVVVLLDDLDDVPLSTNDADTNKKILIDSALTDLGLSTKARICLCAAGEVEKRTIRKQAKIDANFVKIEEALNEIQKYQGTCQVLEVGYYDAFKLQKEKDDFTANVKRLELAGMWDEITEMLKRYELQDNFEARKEWVELGTRYRRLVEPLDIANYYRHGKNDDTGPYMVTGRPKRYKYTQRWLEHARGMAPDSCLESCFLAEVEELCKERGSKRNFEETRERVLLLESEVERSFARGGISRDMFLEESTFVKWWNSLPDQHRAGSHLAVIMEEQRRILLSHN